MLTRFDPFREVEQLFRPWGSWSTSQTGVMPMDAYRRGEEFVVELDLPGVDPGSIDLTVDHNTLQVTARRIARFEEGDRVLVNERPAGQMTRQLLLGEQVDSNAIKASYDAGVLTVVLPVAEEARPRRVPIGTGNGHAKAVEASSRTEEAVHAS